MRHRAQSSVARGLIIHNRIANTAQKSVTSNTPLLYRLYRKPYIVEKDRTQKHLYGKGDLADSFIYVVYTADRIKWWRRTRGAVRDSYTARDIGGQGARDRSIARAIRVNPLLWYSICIPFFLYIALCFKRVYAFMTTMIGEFYMCAVDGHMFGYIHYTHSHRLTSHVSIDIYNLEERCHQNTHAHPTRIGCSRRARNFRDRT